MRRLDPAENSSELPDLDAARREAIALIREVAADMMRCGKPILDHVMVITDEQGRVLDRIAFSDVVLRS